jgi:transposase
MIAIVPQVRILVAVEPVDFRSGIDGLARICKEKLGSDPFCGWLFVFVNRRRTAVKILAYDQQGFWLCQKRLSASRFAYWPTATEAGKVLEAHELQLLLVGGNPATAQAAPAWRRLPAST